MGFGRKPTFGRARLSLEEMKRTLRPQSDGDGVTRVFSRQLWDDPRIGGMLRDLGFGPDDARNVLPTADDYRNRFAAARAALAERTQAFNRAMTERHGYCEARPLLILDSPIWDGPHGAFLYAQLDLMAYDDWNVLMLAADVRTREATGLPGHPGKLPEVTRELTEHVAVWKKRYEFALETFGITATGGNGISRDQFEEEAAAVERDIVAHVEGMKPRILAQLRAAQSSAG